MRIVLLSPFSSGSGRAQWTPPPGQFAIDIKEFAGRIVALEALGKTR